MKLGNIVNPQFQTVLLKLSQAQVPVALAFKLKKMMKKVEEETKTFEEVKTAFIEKFAVRKEDGTIQLNDNGTVTLQPALVQEWEPEFSALLTQEIELPTIKVSELGEKVELSVQELGLLDELVVEG